MSAEIQNTYFVNKILDDTTISQKTQCTEEVQCPYPARTLVPGLVQRSFITPTLFIVWRPVAVLIPFPHHTILGFAPFLPCLPDLQSSHFCRQRADFYLMQKHLCKCLNYIITEDHKVWTVMKSSIFGQTFHFFPQTTYQHIIMMYFNISLNIEYRHTCIFKKHIGERKVWDF